MGVALVALCLSWVAGGAAAQEASPASIDQTATVPVTVGWWTSAQVSGTPVGMATLVPEGGLQVANGSGGPVSIAAVRFAVPAASDAVLVLHLVSGSTPEAASVVACPTTASWAPVRAAALATAPSWDCALGAAGASYDPVARTLSWSFDATLVRDGQLDVMLLPVEAGLPFNVTTEAPGTDAVTTRAHPTDASEPGPAAPPATAAPVASSEDFALPLSFTPSLGGPINPVAPPTAPVGLPSPLPTIPATAVAPTHDAAGGGHWLGVLFLFLVLGMALALWPGLPLIGRVPTSDDVQRGVGRFARPRSDLPQRI